MATPKRSKGARPRRQSLLARWRGWQHHHGQSAAESLAKVLGQPLGSLLTWLVMGIALALPTGLWLMLDNLAAVSRNLDSPAQLTVFLDAAVDAGGATELARSVGGRDDVFSSQFLNRDQALASFVADAAMADLAAGLDENPLPHQLIVTPRSEDPEAVARLSAELAALAEVESVLVDTAWLQRLERLMRLGRRAVQILGALLLLAVVLVLGNTIRLAIEGRRDEIVIIKLVGGTDAFVRRPLLYTGLWFGLGGGIVAALLVTAGTLLLSPLVRDLAATYGSNFTLRGLGVIDSLQLVLLGAVLGLAGAWLAVARHLRAIEPR